MLRTDQSARSNSKTRHFETNKRSARLQTDFPHQPKAEKAPFPD
jgi:hypothetical protein